MSDDLPSTPFTRAVVGFIRKRPWLTLLLGIGFVALLSPGLGRLKADFTHRGFFRETDPQLKRFEAFERRFGNDDVAVVAMHSPSGIFDVESATVLRQLTEKMWQIPEVIRVESLANFQWVHAEGDEIIVESFLPEEGRISQEFLDGRKTIALRHETLPNYLISSDARTALVFARIKPGIEAPPNATLIIESVRQLLTQMQGSDHVFHISGGPAITLAFKEASQLDLEHLVPFVLLVTVVLLVVLLRSWIAVTLSLLVVFLAVLGSMSISGWLGIEITSLTAALPQVLIAICIADSIHILVTFFRSMAQGKERKDAARYALLKNFQPTIITSLTTAIGFFSFISAELKPIAGLGILAGLGTLLAWWMTYTVLGSMLFALPIRSRKIAQHSGDLRQKRLGVLTDLLNRYKRVVVLSFALLCVLATATSFRNTVDSDPFKYFTESFPTRVANEFIEREVGGARGVELVIESGSPEGIKDPGFLRRVDKFQNWINQIPRVTRTVSLVDIIKQTHRSLNGGDDAYYRLPEDREAISQELFLYTMSLPQGMDINDRVTISNDALRLTVLWTIATSRDVMHTIDRIEAMAKDMGLTVEATGKNMLYQSMNGYVVHSFLVSVSTAIVLISVLLMLFFRSVSLGILAMLPNFVPLIFGGAVLWLLGQPLDIGTMIVASVCLGIAVDDTIHVLANYNRYRRNDYSPRDAVVNVFMHTGPAVVVTTLILVMAFGTFAFATFTPNLYFGVMTAIVLTVALITDLTFLPALLLLGGKPTVATTAEGGAEGA
ncbi:MAG: MMPL family transporter [Myxococcota bacterium]